MNKKIIYILFSAVMALAATACGGSDNNTDNGGGNNGGGNTDEYTPYEPSESINSNNLFKVCLMSKMSDEALFDKSDPTVVSDFINGYSGQKPLFYIVERLDCTQGEELQHVNIGYKTKCFSFFAQQQNTAQMVKGSGIITKYSVNDYDGFGVEGTWMSGCTISAPLGTATEMTTYTTRIDSEQQLKTILEQRSIALQSNAVVVGSIKATLKDSTTEYLKKNFRNYRLKYADTQSTAYDLFVMTPVDYCCRQIETGTKVNIPYYIVSIEKLK